MQVQQRAVASRAVARQAVVARPVSLGPLRSVCAQVAAVDAPATKSAPREFARLPDGSFDLSAPPPFSLADIKNAIPDHCWEKDTTRSFMYLFKDLAIVFGLAGAAYYIDSPFVWPLYWLAQGTMFWALFVVGHDCGHRSFSNNNTINDLMGNIIHSSILVPYHGWRISHRTHHANHGHVDNDESWHPIPKKIYDSMDKLGRVGRLELPWPMFAFPFYLWKRSPGKEGSHYDPSSPLFVPAERNMILTSNACMVGMLAVIAACTYKLGFVEMLNLYWIPYWVNVMLLDMGTYLHHHGTDEKMPWYRDPEWTYLRGGLTTLDHDYGILSKIQHDIGTHVVHHLFPQMPHYNLCEATDAVKPVLGPYYREPIKSGPIPFHLFKLLKQSFEKDHYVPDEGSIVYYQKDPEVGLFGVKK